MKRQTETQQIRTNPNKPGPARTAEKPHNRFPVLKREINGNFTPVAADSFRRGSRGRSPSQREDAFKTEQAERTLANWAPLLTSPSRGEGLRGDCGKVAVCA